MDEPVSDSIDGGEPSQSIPLSMNACDAGDLNNLATQPNEFVDEVAPRQDLPVEIKITQTFLESEIHQDGSTTANTSDSLEETEKSLDQQSSQADQRNLPKRTEQSCSDLPSPELFINKPSSSEVQIIEVIKINPMLEEFQSGHKTESSITDNSILPPVSNEAGNRVISCTEAPMEIEEPATVVPGRVEEIQQEIQISIKSSGSSEVMNVPLVGKSNNQNDHSLPEEQNDSDLQSQELLPKKPSEVKIIEVINIKPASKESQRDYAGLLPNAYSSIDSSKNLNESCNEIMSCKVVSIENEEPMQSLPKSVEQIEQEVQESVNSLDCLMQNNKYSINHPNQLEGRNMSTSSPGAPTIDAMKKSPMPEEPQEDMLIEASSSTESDIVQNYSEFSKKQISENVDNKQKEVVDVKCLSSEASKSPSALNVRLETNTETNTQMEVQKDPDEFNIQLETKTGTQNSLEAQKDSNTCNVQLETNAEIRALVTNATSSLSLLAQYNSESDDDGDNNNEENNVDGTDSASVVEVPPANVGYRNRVIEIDTDSDSDTSKSDSSSDVEYLNEIRKTIEKSLDDGDAEDDEMEEEDGSKIKRRPLRVKGEFLLEDLPPIQDLHITVPEDECVELGKVHSVVEQLVLVSALPDSILLDLDTVLFLEKGKRVLGEVFDVLGQVADPLYCVRFNSNEQIKEKNIKVGDVVYVAPKTEHTQYLILANLLRMRGSDASWENDVEPPPQFLAYSDDEQERAARAKFRNKNRNNSSNNNSDNNDDNTKRLCVEIKEEEEYFTPDPSPSPSPVPSPLPYPRQPFNQRYQSRGGRGRGPRYSGYRNSPRYSHNPQNYSHNYYPGSWHSNYPQQYEIPQRYFGDIRPYVYPSQFSNFPVHGGLPYPMRPQPPPAPPQKPVGFRPNLYGGRGQVMDFPYDPSQIFKTTGSPPPPPGAQ